MPDKFGKTLTKVFESEDKYNEWKDKEPVIVKRRGPLRKLPKL